MSGIAVFASLIVGLAAFQLNAAALGFFVQDGKAELGQSKTGTDSDSGIETIDCLGRIERQLDGSNSVHYVAGVSGLTLSGARKYRLKLRIVNPFDETIEFSRVSLSCGCAKFESEQKEIPALGTADFIMYLEAPNNIEITSDRVTVKFYADRHDVSPKLALNVTFSVQGVFGFQNDRAIIEVPKSEELVTAKLPITIVEPIKLDQLELFLTDNLRDFGVQIVSNDPESSVPYIKIDVARLSLPRDGIAGEVGVRRIGSSMRSGVIVTIRHQDSFTLRPESIRLSRDNHSKPYQAFAMLRVIENTKGEKGGLKGEKGGLDVVERPVLVSPNVALSIDGKPARVRVQRLGQAGLYRLTIQHDGPFEVDSDGTVRVRWGIVFNGEERVIESHAFLPDR